MALVISGCSAGTYKKQNLDVNEVKTILLTNQKGAGPEIILDFKKGDAFYYPLMAIWIEDISGNYIQTLYVANSVATGIFKFGKQENNKWASAPKRAPQTLPYWSHKRGIKASDGLYMPDPENPVPDAYSGATPVQSFTVIGKADKQLPPVFRVLFEINQNWDWNEYWTNDKFPEDENYKWSCQPALVYEAVVDMKNHAGIFKMRAIGHSHYSGKTGELFSDISTLTTAMHIADSISVRIK